MNDRNKTGKKTRFVVTGMGCVNSLGDNPEIFFRNLCSGLSGITEISGFQTEKYRCKMGGEVNDKYYQNECTNNKLYSMSLKAVSDAISEAGLEKLTDVEIEKSHQIAMVAGTLFGMRPVINSVLDMNTPDMDINSRKKAFEEYHSSSFCDRLCNELKIFGQRYTFCDACATGLNIIQNGCYLLETGKAEFVICIGAEILNEFLQCIMSQLRVLAQKAIAPFDKNRKGTILGEGSAALVLETLEHAKARGAEVLAEIGGSSVSCEAYDMVAPQSSGSGMLKVMDQAIKQSGLDTREIQYINAHGTGTVLNDKAESKAIKSLFGERANDVFVSSTKSGIGHLCAAAGIIEVIICIQAIRKGVLPPTINYTSPDPECDLNLVINSSQNMDVQNVLTNSFGFGGNNASMVIKKYIE